MIAFFFLSEFKKLKKKNRRKLNEREEYDKRSNSALTLLHNKLVNRARC